MPQLGEIRTNDKWQKFIWAACEKCGKARWNLIVRKKPRSKLCRQCASPLNQVHIWGNYQAQSEKNYKVRFLIQKLVKKGVIKKLVCAECGDAKTVGHHPDYSKPLEVVWLCQKHHTETHRTLQTK